MNIRLRELRLEYGLTQKELAQKIKSTDKSVWAYEKGLATPPSEVLVAYAKYFNVTTDYLLGVTDEFGTPTAAQTVEVVSPDKAKTEKERELLRSFRELSPYLQDVAVDTVRSWAGRRSSGDLPKKA